MLSARDCRCKSIVVGPLSTKRPENWERKAILGLGVAERNKFGEFAFKTDLSSSVKAQKAISIMIPCHMTPHIINQDSSFEICVEFPSNTVDGTRKKVELSY